MPGVNSEAVARGQQRAHARFSLKIKEEDTCAQLQLISTDLLVYGKLLTF